MRGREAVVQGMKERPIYLLFQTLFEEAQTITDGFWKTREVEPHIESGFRFPIDSNPGNLFQTFKNVISLALEMLLKGNHITCDPVEFEHGNRGLLEA
jgi:hypothetical protein